MASQIFVDIFFYDPNITKNNALADFNDKNVDNLCFVKVSMENVGEHSRAK